jgi:hypothetical protein
MVWIADDSSSATSKSRGRRKKYIVLVGCLGFRTLRVYDADGCLVKLSCKAHARVEQVGIDCKVAHGMHTDTQRKETTTLSYCAQCTSLGEQGLGFKPWSTSHCRSKVITPGGPSIQECAHW